LVPPANENDGGGKSAFASKELEEFHNMMVAKLDDGLNKALKRKKKEELTEEEQKE
jgi:hypothetical protein